MKEKGAMNLSQPKGLPSVPRRWPWLVGILVVVLGVGIAAWLLRDRLPSSLSFSSREQPPVDAAVYAASPIAVTVDTLRQSLDLTLAEAKHRVQLKTVYALWFALHEYRRQYNVYPVSLAELQDHYPDLYASCLKIENCKLGVTEGTLPLPLDAYTGVPFPYEWKDKDFQLVFWLESCGQSCDRRLEKQEQAWAVFGKNTMTSEAVSVEKNFKPPFNLNAATNATPVGG